MELREEYFRKNNCKHDKLNWNSTQIEFIELIRFLVKTKLVSKENEVLSLNEAINIFSGLFDMNVNWVYSKISKAKQRKKGSCPKVYQKWTSFQQSEEYLNE